MKCRKVDAFTHFAPRELMNFLEQQSENGKAPFSSLFDKIESLTCVEKRLELMDSLNIDTHVLVPLPWLETMPNISKNPKLAIEACRICNIQMSQLQNAYPSRFISVGLIPTSCGKAAMHAGYEFAVKTLGLAGVVLFIGPESVPPDDSNYEELYERCSKDGVPIWLHPNRPQSFSDYEVNKSGVGSKYMIWNSLGWIYDTSVAMHHIAMSGVFRRYPDIKIVAHHGGGMVPFFTERFVTQTQNFKNDDNGTNGNGSDANESMLEDLKLFYVDTATFGYQPSNINASLNFFHENHVLFGTDTPMDMGNSGYFCKTSIGGIEHLVDCGIIGQKEKEKIFWDNTMQALFGEEVRNRVNLRPKL